MSARECIVGDCIEVMRGMAEASVDAIVTDPPYGLGFMGKAWDGLPPGPEFASEALRVLRPGGHLLAFGGTRTFHRLVVALEDAGFEIRDTIAWLYGSGFPKSLDVSKAIDKAAGVEFTAKPASGVGFMRADGRDGYNVTKNQLERAGESTPDAVTWSGWGTALKPAHEPIVVARKPLVGTVATNVLEHGTGALNVDGCRIAAQGRPLVVSDSRPSENTYGDGLNGSQAAGTTDAGRWPANVVLDEEAAELLDEQTGELKSGEVRPHHRNHGKDDDQTFGKFGGDIPIVGYGDKGGASRFFYCAKASRKERNAGLDGFEPGARPLGISQWTGQTNGSGRQMGPSSPQANTHPTVKPVALMRWLVRLVTPPNGLVLDPFLGSGTTGVAAALEGVSFVGIEREAEYADIARARIAHAYWDNAE